MYTIVERRKANRERMQETVQKAQTDFFPHMQAAPGFIGFYLVADELNGINTAVLVWESKEKAEAFEKQVGKGWQQTLEQYGHTLQSDNRGETVIELQPKK